MLKAITQPIAASTTAAAPPLQAVATAKTDPIKPIVFEVSAKEVVLAAFLLNEYAFVKSDEPPLTTLSLVQ